MSAPLSTVVTLAITSDSVGLARQSFGIPMILSHTASWSERVRSYSSSAEVADDFAIDTPEYLAANAMFSQNPHPQTVKIGRCALKPTMKYTLAATAADSTAYDIAVAGVGVTATDVTYTSDAAATVAEIHSGLVTALNAVVGNNYIAAFAPLVYADAVFTADNTTEIFTIAAHGLQTGDGPFQVSNSGGGLPAGLSALTDYYIIKIDANTFYLATSLANALAGTHLSITTNGTGTQTLADTVSTVRPSDPFTVTADTAGDWFSLAIESMDLLSIKLSHSDPGVATDLTAIAREDDDWYALYTFMNSKAYVAGVAGYIEAVRKIYIFDLPETDCATVAYSDGLTDDTGAQQHTLARTRSAGLFHNSPADMAGAAWIGVVLPLDPGSATWDLKTLSGVTPVTMTSTQRTNLKDRKLNVYETMAGRNLTFDGTMFVGGGAGFIDTIQGIDWIFDDMTKSVAEGLVAMPKVPFTDDGVALIEGQIRGTLKRAIDMDILASDPAPVVTVPRVKNVSTANKSIRNLPDVKWSATLSGAVQHVTINGVVSV